MTISVSGAAPQVVKHFGDVVRRRVTDGQRNEGELAEHRLQERQMHLERVFLERMPASLRTICGRASRRAIAAPSSGMMPSGVAKASAFGTAMPSTATRWVGPSSTTRRIVRTPGGKCRVDAMAAIGPE